MRSSNLVLTALTAALIHGGIAAAAPPVSRRSSVSPQTAPSRTARQTTPPRSQVPSRGSQSRTTTGQPQVPAGATAEQVERRVTAMQHHLDSLQKQLQQRLAKAQALRQKALSDNNHDLLERVEKYERAVFAAYTKEVQRIENGGRLSPTRSTSHSRSRSGTPSQNRSGTRRPGNESESKDRTTKGPIRKFFNY